MGSSDTLSILVGCEWVWGACIYSVGTSLDAARRLFSMCVCDIVVEVGSEAIVTDDCSSERDHGVPEGCMIVETCVDSGDLVRITRLGWTSFGCIFGE